MIYRKSTTNWLSEAPKYKYDLTSGNFQLKVLNFTKERYLFEIYFQESDTRFLVSAKDETIRNTWVHWLTGTKYVDPFTNSGKYQLILNSMKCLLINENYLFYFYSIGSVYLVKVLETLDTRKFNISGVCYLHLLKEKFLLTKISDRSLLAEWPIEVVRFYASRQDLLKLELGRKAMHGEMILYFQTQKAKEVFHTIKSYISGDQTAVPKDHEAPAKQKDSSFPVYATVNMKKKANRRVQLEGEKSELALRTFYTPPPTTPCDYVPVSVNMDELEQQQTEASKQLIPFEMFEEYDTLQHLKSAFGGSRSSSSQSDTSENDSTPGEYSTICDFKRPPPPPPPPKPVTICFREKNTRKSVFEQAEYSTVRHSRIPSSFSTHNLMSPKQIVTDLWSCQFKPPIPSSGRHAQTQFRKKSSGIDESVNQALDSIVIPDSTTNALLETPITTLAEEWCPKIATRGVYRRNGTRHRNKIIKPALVPELYTCKAY